MHDDAFADRIARFRVVAQEIVVERAKLIVAEHRAGDFGQRVLQRQKRVARRAGDACLISRREGRRMGRAIALEKFKPALHRFLPAFLMHLKARIGFSASTNPSARSNANKRTATSWFCSAASKDCRDAGAMLMLS
jgi:hypothetical protein